MNTTKKILTATLVGAVVGVATGILVAPDKGSVTRKRIAKRSKKIADRVSDLVEHSKETITSITGKLRGKKSDRAFEDFPVEDSIT